MKRPTTGLSRRINALFDLALRRARESEFTRNTLWMLVGQGLRTVVQIVYFFLIARALGKDGFGMFVGTIAYVLVLYPFSGLGCGSLLIKNVARRPALFAAYWGRGLATIAGTGILLMLFAVATAHAFLPPEVPTLLVALLALADIVFTRLVDLGSEAYMAFHRLDRTAQLWFVFSGMRMIAAMALLLLPIDPSPLVWGFFYLGSTALSAAVAVFIVVRELGPPHFGGPRAAGEFTEGFYFSLSLASQNLYNEIDKTMLARLSGVGTAGSYGAAYRVVDQAFTPIRAMVYAAYARFFLHGEQGIAGGRALAMSLLPMATGLGLAAGIMLYALAPLLPSILGEGYEESVPALRLLALLPILKALHYFPADALSGSGYQWLRTALQCLVAGMTVLGNLIAIPRYGWQGAACCCLGANALLVVLVWAAVIAVARAEGNGRPAGGMQ